MSAVIFDPVVQSPFAVLTGLFNPKCNLLKARVVIHAYNQHVRLSFLPSAVVVRQPQFTRAEGVGIVMQSNGSNTSHFPSISLTRSLCAASFGVGATRTRERIGAR